ncbi:MAG: MFS transporter [Candidatus Dormiibacterota bacterium]
MTTEQRVATLPATYRRLLRVPGFRQLLISSLLTRTAAQMWTVGLIIFALQRYHSPSVAGVSLFLLIFPGLLLSPIAGALLDRHGRKRLMTLDFIIAAVCLTVIVLLAGAGRLPVWGLYALLVGGSLTSTLSIAGARSFFPSIVPRDMWDRGNAADSVLYGVANIAGPGLAGVLIATIGSEAALAGAAVAYLAGAVALQGVPEPARSDEVSGRILYEAWRGLRYVVTNRTLRWIAVSFSTLNVGWGMVIVALPVIVFHLRGNAAVVGLMLALAGVAGIPAALVAGRIRTEGRERESMAVFGVVMGIAVLALLVPSLPLIALGIAIAGGADAASSVSAFSLRQRRTPRAWFGRAFAVAMAFNFSGVPIGSALAGPVLGVSTTFTILVAAGLTLGASVVMRLKIPASNGAPA